MLSHLGLIWGECREWTLVQRKKKAEAQGFGRGCVTWAKWQIKVEVFSPQFLALKPVCETDAAFDVEGKKKEEK